MSDRGTMLIPHKEIRTLNFGGVKHSALRYGCAFVNCRYQLIAYFIPICRGESVLNTSGSKKMHMMTYWTAAE